MKVLAITAFYPPNQRGGYELRCKDVLEGLQERGHDILILTNQPDEKTSSVLINPPHVHRVLKQKKSRDNVFSEIHYDNLEIKKIQRVYKSFKPDLIYLWHMQNLSDALIPFLAKQEIPMVYDEGGFGMIYFSRLQKRGLYFYKNKQELIIKKFLKMIIKTYARAISNGKIIPDWDWPDNMRIYFNSYSALDHAKNLGAMIDKASVIHSGIHMDLFPYREREKMRLPIKIIMPGRIKRQKGSIDGVRLIDELGKINIPAQLLIIGKIESSDYYDFLNKSIKDKELSNLVRIEDMVSQEELSCLYRSFDICFFPSYFKTGLSRVPLEAMASGCLVMTYGNEGSSESVIHKETGIIIEEGEINACSEWVIRVIENPTFYQKIVRKARINVEENFSMNAYLKKIDDFLQINLHLFDN